MLHPLVATPPPHSNTGDISVQLSGNLSHALESVILTYLYKMMWGFRGKPSKPLLKHYARAYYPLKGISLHLDTAKILKA